MLPQLRRGARHFIRNTKPRSQVIHRGQSSSTSEIIPFENAMKRVENEFNRLQRQMDSMFQKFGFGQPSYGAATASRPSLDSDVSASYEDPNKYKLSLDLGQGVNPESIKLTLKNRLLTVQANSEQCSEDGSSRLYQEITRQITLPEGINPREVKSMIGPDGRLLIEAQTPIPQDKMPKRIPISIDRESSR